MKSPCAHTFTSTAGRTFRISIFEQPARTLVWFEIDRTGPFAPGEQEEMVGRLAPLIRKYDGDGKPLVMIDPRGKRRMTAYDPGVAVVTEESDPWRLVQ